MFCSCYISNCFYRVYHTRPSYVEKMTDGKDHAWNYGFKCHCMHLLIKGQCKTNYGIFFIYSFSQIKFTARIIKAILWLFFFFMFYVHLLCTLVAYHEYSIYYCNYNYDTVCCNCSNKNQI